jgi:DNA methylase
VIDAPPNRILEPFAASPENGAVVCLGRTFASDEARRAYYLERLREKLQDPAFRALEGFPAGDDEEILALSDPPYYTACPNPFLQEFVQHYGRPYDPGEPYHTEPFAADVSEGKNDPIYNAHAYHTKVPHKALMRYILHYTQPGDLIFDGFCGTGMAGVAAQMCGAPDADFRAQIEREMPGVQWGARRALLCDLSPAASFIAHCYNTAFDAELFAAEARRILRTVQERYGWAYTTTVDGRSYPVDYFVFSDVFLCADCGGEIVFLDAALTAAGAVREPFPCPHCGAESRKRTLTRAVVTEIDPVLGQPIRRARTELARVAYRGARGRVTKKADDADRALLRRAEALEVPEWFPVVRMSDGDEGRRNDALGLTHLHHFFTRRALACLAALWAEAHRADRRVRDYLLFTVEQNIWGMSRLARYVPRHFSQVNQYLSGTLYVGSQVVDVAPEYILEGKIARLARVLASQRGFGPGAAVGCGSLTATPCPDNAVDYIFLDPPFGANLSYSDLNFLWEAWLRVRTTVRPEAIVSAAHAKGPAEYQALMTACFRECCRILKPGRWMTVAFHNSRSAVWAALQDALAAAGFIVADVRVLDKQHHTFKQLNGAGAVRGDLILSARKPALPLPERRPLQAGTEEGVWEFVRAHLAQLPSGLSGHTEMLPERRRHLLFDRMVAFHVQRGLTVPLSAPAFYAGLRQRFSVRDGMYFLPEQPAGDDRR